jgi:hypothetical protein
LQYASREGIGEIIEIPGEWRDSLTDGGLKEQIEYSVSLFQKRQAVD